MALSQSINALDVTPAIAPIVTALRYLGLILVTSSRGRIWVTVFIGDCQALVPSSSEGCSSLQKTVKVEAYSTSILALSDRSWVRGSISVYQCSWCHSCYRSNCHSTTVAWIVHGRRLKMHNQGNGFHQWLSGACVFLLRGVLNFTEKSQGGSLLT